MAPLACRPVAVALLACAGRSVLAALGASADEFSEALQLEALAKDDGCLAGSTDAQCAVALHQLRGQLLAQGRRTDTALRTDDAARGSAEESATQAAAAAVAVAANATAGGPPFGHPSASVVYPQYDGFTLWLAEEFDQPLDLDSDPVWTWSDGGLSEGSVRFTKEQIHFGGGVMRIVAQPDHGSRIRPCSHAQKATVGPKPLVSGELRTKHNMFRYGRYEVRMKAPSVQPGNPNINGNYISTMFVYRDGSFQFWREIDFEITGDGPSAVTTNMLRADHTATWSPGIQRSSHHQVGGLNTRQDFHTYAFEWLPDKITWYIDGQKVREQGQGSLPIPDKSGKIMMNLWIFGPSAGFGGSSIHNNRYPMTAEYEYFRFYKWDGEKQYPCPGMSSSCLSKGDFYLSGNNPCDGIVQVGELPGGLQACRATC